MDNGTYYSYFICPLDDGDDSYTFCCGPDDREHCCSVFEKNSETASACPPGHKLEVTGPIGILVIIGPAGIRDTVGQTGTLEAVIGIPEPEFQLVERDLRKFPNNTHLFKLSYLHTKQKNNYKLYISSHFSAGSIAGGVIGVFLILLLVGIVGFLCYRRKQGQPSFSSGTVVTGKWTFQMHKT